MVTDLDVLAFRFASAGPARAASGSDAPLVSTLGEPDPALSRVRGESDMIVGELKEALAELNRGARDPRVLEAALVRFGCCEAGEGERVEKELLRRGEVDTKHGHRVRLVAFGATLPQGGSRGYTAISLGYIVSFLRGQGWSPART
jgi:hypothetical protein